MPTPFVRAHPPPAGFDMAAAGKMEMACKDGVKAQSSIAVIHHLIAKIVAGGALAASLWAVAVGGAYAAQNQLAGRIAYLGIDENIYVCRGECAKPECITCPSNGIEVHNHGGALIQAAIRVANGPTSYNWPTFSPDGQRLAYVAINRAPESVLSGIDVYEFARHESVRIYESDRGAPIYLFWLPDNQTISFLVSQRRSLHLMVAKAQQKAQARSLTSGTPLYYDWNQPLNKLVVHTSSANRSEQVFLMSVAGGIGKVETVLTRGRTPFSSPAWSPDRAHLAYIAMVGEEAKLFLADADGKHAHAVVKLLPGDSSFEWAPDSRHIAFTSGEFADHFIFHGLRWLDIADLSVRELTKDPINAYFIAPDSHSIAYVSVPARRPFYTWEVLDLASGKTRHLGNFITTREEAIAYRYFEQLSLSHNIWAPDSSAIVFAGVLIRGEPRNTTGPAPAPLVWIMPIDQSKPRQVGEGTLAFWSPAPAR
jgi:Tol biopolymer transport system component